MFALTLSCPAAALQNVRGLAREVAMCPTPEARGLRARHWKAEAESFRGRYLFVDRDSLADFESNPGMDPAFRRIASSAGTLCWTTSKDQSEPGVRLDRPVFIIAAPRAGSTLLYELLAESSDLWTIGGESEGVIEGIRKLHPSIRGFESHRLTEEDVDPEVVDALHAALVIELRDRGGQRFLELSKGKRPAEIRLLEKTPENSLRIPFLATAFPTALFVFLHREVRQNVSSILEAWHHEGFVNIPNLPGWRRARWNFLLPEGWQALSGSSLLDVALFQWSAANQRVLDDFEGLPNDRWMAVEYDEIIVSPEEVVRRICNFADIKVDEYLKAAAARPLRVSSTTISSPSPIKWRYNPEFRESAISRTTLVSARLRDLGRNSAPPPPPRQWNAPVRYSCTLDELPLSPIQNGNEWIVDPTFHVQIGATIPLSLLRRTRFREKFVNDCPILWVEDSATNVIYPYWASPRYAHVFHNFIAGQQPPPMDIDLARQLTSAGILVTQAGLSHRRQWGEDCVQRAQPQFAERRYCELPSLIHPAHAAALSQYYAALIKQGEWSLGDGQVQRRYGWHNETVSRFFHHQLTSLISRIALEPVKPAYAYISAYKEGAVLKPHVDRKQCVFTLSVLIEHSAEPSQERWPLWLLTHTGKISVTQESGGAVLFRGCELPHWRDRRPEGHNSTTLIFHYVPARFQGVLD